jgi:transposase InsO family protein
MRRKRRKIWEMDIGMQISKKDDIIYGFNQFNSIDSMQTIAENVLNPLRYHLSPEAKKRLKWMYIIRYKCKGNIKRSANKIGVSRQWLSAIYNKWKRSNYDPRLLEPISKTPKSTNNRKRIDKEVEDKIVELRKKYHWGKDKLATVLERDYSMQAGATTVNRYLNKHGLLNIKISNKNIMAHKNKVEQKQKVRPPKEIKDYKPGALIEKDMKFVVKSGQFLNYEKHKAKENFWYQHTVIDSFTRIRTIGLAEDGNSKTAVIVQEECSKRMPFQIACANTDNGAENEKDFDEYLEKNNIVHFYSRSGMPTDNPRVERSHLTDDVEFYDHGNICDTFAKQKEKLFDWEFIYNYIRPHQALGNLTPVEFHRLWKKDPDEAHAISRKWSTYLNKQRKRLANSRKMRSKEKIDKLMMQIDRKLSEVN